jgi:hypothetical protein
VPSSLETASASLCSCSTVLIANLDKDRSVDCSVELPAPMAAWDFWRQGIGCWGIGKGIYGISTVAIAQLIQSVAEDGEIVRALILSTSKYLRMQVVVMYLTYASNTYYNQSNNYYMQSGSYPIGCRHFAFLVISIYIVMGQSPKNHLIRALVLPCRTLNILSFRRDRKGRSFTEDRKRFEDYGRSFGLQAPYESFLTYTDIYRLRRQAALKSGHFQDTRNSPTRAIYKNSNIGFRLNLSIIKF